MFLIRDTISLLFNDRFSKLEEIPMLHLEALHSCFANMTACASTAESGRPTYQ